MGATRRGRWAAAAGRRLVDGVGRTLSDDVGRWVTARLESGRVQAEDRLQTARMQLAARRDPVRRHRRRLRWAQRSLAARGLAAVGLAWVTTEVGTVPGVELGEVFWGASTAAVAVSAAGTARRVWQLRRSTPLPAPRPVPLPPASAARGPIDRLTERERSLSTLLGHLGPAAAETGGVATEAGVALRDLAARVAAVETARRGAPPESHAGLDAAVAVLLRQLDEGVAAYEALVVAAADAVSAATALGGRDSLLARRLDEAADQLAGFAAGLREISDPSGT